MSIHSRGISASIHQWEEGGRIEVRTFNGGSNPKMVHIKVWMDHRPSEVTARSGVLNMTNWDLTIPEDTAISILQALARMYPTACAEALGYEEEPECAACAADD